MSGVRTCLVRNELKQLLYDLRLLKKTLTTHWLTHCECVLTDSPSQILLIRPLSLQAHSFCKWNSIICCLIQQSFHYLHIIFDQCYKSTVMFNTRLIWTCQTLMMTILLINFALDEIRSLVYIMIFQQMS